MLEAWNNGGLDISIKKVFDRIRPTLCNIVEGEGGEFVETRRGAKFKDIKVKQILTELRGGDLLPEANYMVGGKEEDDGQ